jgi:hypothetical protein
MQLVFSLLVCETLTVDDAKVFEAEWHGAGVGSERTEIHLPVPPMSPLVSPGVG